MISITWLFIGVIVGLLVVSVFAPPARILPGVPTPDNDSLFYTKSGCVKFETKEVECMPSATSLNFIASQQE
jgi:hypothetical protein